MKKHIDWTGSVSSGTPRACPWGSTWFRQVVSRTAGLSGATSRL